MSVITSVDKLERVKAERALVNRFMKMEEKADAIVEEATGMAAPVRQELKRTNDQILDELERKQGQGFDGIDLPIDGVMHCLKRKRPRSAKSCRLAHLEEAYESLTAEHLAAEQEECAGATASEYFCRAIIKRLRANGDLFSASSQLILDTRPIEKKHVAPEPGEDGSIRVANADQRVYDLVRRRRDLQEQMAALNKQVAAARKRAKNMRGKVDRDALRGAVERWNAAGKAVKVQGADGRTRKLAATQKQVKPTINVTTFDKGGLLRQIVDDGGLADLRDDDDFDAWLNPDVKQRFLEACRCGIESYITDNTKCVDDLKTTKQRVKRPPGFKPINGTV